MKTKLWAGPWVGEFGWELFAWQGHLRYLKKRYEHITVCCQSGHEYLYEDFAEVIFHDFNTDNSNMYMCEGIDMNKLSIPGELFDTDIFRPINLFNYKQVFIRYGTHIIDKGFDIVYHARNITRHNTSMFNWSVNNWHELLDRFIGRGRKIAAIGTIDGALHFENTVDMRGISLRDLSVILASSKILIGPSSGPMHYGALCGIPHVVWSGYTRSDFRYREKWNPFSTTVRTIIDADDSWSRREPWSPSIKQVYDNIMELTGNKL